MTKGLVHQEDIAILNVYVPNSRAARYVKQKLIELKWETDKPIIVIRNFNIPLLTTDRTSQKPAKTQKNSKSSTNGLAFIKYFNHNSRIHSFFKCPQIIYYILGHKTNLKKFKIFGIIISRIRKYYKQIYTHTSDNLEETDQYLNKIKTTNYHYHSI